MNKLMTEDMGRNKKARLDALGRAIAREIPVGGTDHDSSLDDVVDRLRRID